MDSSDRYKVSDHDAAVWTLIYKLVKAAQGDPFEASRRVAELIAPELEKAQKYDEAYSRWPSIVDHERWWKETKEILETREVKDGQ